MTKPPRPKFVASLTFRGFDMAPGEVEALLGVPATELGTAGTPRKPGTRVLQRSFASWALPFPDETLMVDMLPALINWLGGTERLLAVKQAVAPKHFEVDLALWVKDSDEQEGGFMDISTVAALAKIGASLGIGIYSRDDV